MVRIGNDWDAVLADEFKKDYYLKLREFLKREYATKTVYPDMYSIFNALKLTPLSKVRAVILGQDPYHEPGQAMGLCFSVGDSTRLPPSLVNIYKELDSDLGLPPSKSGDLSCWARQGVLLLNTVLTVRRGEANSHRRMGWEQLTDRIISCVNEKKEPVVFILWGSPAQRKKAMLNNPDHLILTAPHPSPLSAHRGFFGSRPFSKTNEFLLSHGVEPVDWQIE